MAIFSVIPSEAAQGAAQSRDLFLWLSRQADAPAAPKQAMTALLSGRLSDTSNGRGAATTLKTWPSMVRKNSPNRNAASTAADRAEAGRNSLYDTLNYGY